MGEFHPLAASHDALNRMRRAHERGTGCHLTAAMIRSLSLTTFGEVWQEDDPRALDGPEDSSYSSLNTSESQETP